ncbi:MAG: hypothetical protein K9H15_13455 [Bacteroidales bacterium]|nr:hypothetical protein [Bacteroidales bacterium]
MLFPEEGIRLGKDTDLRFISARSLLSDDTFDTPYTDSLISQSEFTDDPEAPFLARPGFRDTIQLLQTDAVTDMEDSIRLVPVLTDSMVQARIERIGKRVFPLEYPIEFREELQTFFRRAVGSMTNGEVIRILHYGDSQIENDRMTALLRYRFQRIFGGSGVGMVPAVPLYSGNLAFRQQTEGEWVRYTGFGKRDTTLGHACFGTMACYTAVPLPGEGDFPSLEFSFLQGRRTKQFSQIRIFLHAVADSGRIAFHYNDTIADTVMLAAAGYSELAVEFPFSPDKVKMGFDMKGGGRIYGISFDPLAGVQVDNIALRGSSGLELGRLDEEVMDTMLQALNPGLIIMQFGGNMVPYVRNTAFYRQALRRELGYLKRLCPGVAIVVIGPSDMSTRVNGRYTTYEKLEPVRDAMREAALESGCAFWDMYAAMGGEQSIRNFVLADPPLARPDHVHFTPRGANMMAGMFFEAVMAERVEKVRER